MARETPQRRRRQRGGLDAAVGLIVNVVALVFANIYPVWLPWTHGVVTDAFPDVLWAMNLAFAVQIAGNAMLIPVHPPWAWRLADLAFALAGLLSVSVFYAVFPLDWSVIGYDWVNLLARVLLILAIVGVSIAVVVDLVRVIFAGHAADEPGTSA